MPIRAGRTARGRRGGAKTLPDTGQQPNIQTLPDTGQRATVQPLQQGGTLGSFAADLIESLGGKPTPQAQKLFQSWQRWEGGWSANAAKYNPLNLTAPGSGLPTINSVGVVAMPSYQEGVRRTSELLRSGYPALAQAFQTGQVNFQNPAVQADLNRWLSGKRTPGMTPYVRKIAGSFGQELGALPAVPAGGGAPPATTAPGVTQQPVTQQWQLGPPKFEPEMFRSQIRNAFLTGGGRIDPMQMPGMFQSSFQARLQPMQPAPPTRALQGVPAPSGAVGATPGAAVPIKGDLLVTSKGWKETPHAGGHTGGLPEFTQPADIMGNPGKPIGAPTSGVITKIGTAQEGGQSYYITGDDGYEYWLGHIDARLPVGSRIKANQVIATISGEHPRPHLHIDRRKI